PPAVRRAGRGGQPGAAGEGGAVGGTGVEGALELLARGDVPVRRIWGTRAWTVRGAAQRRVLGTARPAAEGGAGRGVRTQVVSAGGDRARPGPQGSRAVGGETSG